MYTQIIITIYFGKHINNDLSIIKIVSSDYPNKHQSFFFLLWKFIKIFQIINFNHKFAIFWDPIKKKKTLLAYLSSSFLQTPKQQKTITQKSIFIFIFLNFQIGRAHV